MQPSDARQQLIALAGGPDPYAFLQSAVRFLDSDPQDGEIRLRAVSTFARLGLFELALELLDARPELAATNAELARARVAFAAQPSRRVAFAALHDTFQANWSALTEKQASLAPRRAELLAALDGLDLHRAADGNWLLSRRTGSGPRRWLPTILDWQGVVRQLDILPRSPQSVCLPYLIEGVGFGELFRHVFDGTRKLLVTFTPRIHVLELNLAQLGVWLHLSDERARIASARVHFWIGERGADELLEFCRARPREVPPAMVIRSPGWAAASAAAGQRVIDILQKESRERVAERLASIRGGLEGRSSPADVAARLAERRTRPLRILGVTSRFTTFLQYSMRDIAEAARAAGHEFHTLIEDSDHTPMLPREYTLGQIDEFRPDLIVTIDHNRSEFRELYDYPIPFCNWIQDDLPNLFGPGCGAQLHRYDLVVGLISSRSAGASGYPRAQWKSLPVPVSRRSFHPAPLTASERAALECDVSFVTNLSQTADDLLARTLGGTPSPQLRRLLEVLHETLPGRIAADGVPSSRIQLIGLLQALARDVGFELPEPDAERVRQLFAERLVNIHYRQQVLQWASAAGLNLHIYGRGWESHPTLAKHARGVAEHGEHLRRIYQAARINIQAVASCAVHQRLLEGLCSGGFFVIRRTPFDRMGALAQSIRRRCLSLGLRSEVELAACDEAELRADVRRYVEAMYAPGGLYAGFVEDLHVIEERGYPLEAGLLLPHYDEVSFGTRAEFEAVARRFLSDSDTRARIAAEQRAVVEKHFTYDAALERIFEFAQRRFLALADTMAARAVQTVNAAS